VRLKRKLHHALDSLLSDYWTEDHNAGWRKRIEEAHALIDTIPDAPSLTSEVEEAIYLARRGHEPNCPCDNCAKILRLSSLLRQDWADRKALEEQQARDTVALNECHTEIGRLHNALAQARRETADAIVTILDEEDALNHTQIKERLLYRIRARFGGEER